MADRTWIILVDGKPHGMFTSLDGVRDALAVLYREDVERIDQIAVNEFVDGHIVRVGAARRVLDPRNVDLPS